MKGKRCRLNKPMSITFKTYFSNFGQNCTQTWVVRLAFKVWSLLKAVNISFDFVAGEGWKLKAVPDYPRPKRKGILALSLACLLEIDGEHLGWCSFYRLGARLLVATVAPPSGSGGGLCLKDTTESETGILQAPTLPTPVNNTKGNSKWNRLCSNRLGL